VDIDDLLRKPLEEDWYENASKYFSKNKNQKMVEEVRKLNWEFVFAGVNVDIEI